MRNLFLAFKEVFQDCRIAFPWYSIRQRQGKRAMLKTVEATVDPDGKVHLREPVELSHPCRAIVTIIEESESYGTALLSERALAVDWNRQEEDEAWSHLQRAP